MKRHGRKLRVYCLVKESLFWSECGYSTAPCPFPAASHGLSCSVQSPLWPPPTSCANLPVGWLPPPHLQWLTNRRMGTHHPFPSGPSSFVIFSFSPPHIGQWTHPFCGSIPFVRYTSHLWGFVRIPHTVARSDAWNIPGLSWERSSAPSFSLPWSLLSVEAGFFSLRGLILPIPKFSGVRILLDASLVSTFLLSPSSWCISSVVLAPIQSPEALLYHSNQTWGKRQTSGAVLTSACWGIGERNWTLTGGNGRAFNLSFFWGLPSLSQFSFPHCGTNHSGLPPQTSAYNWGGGLGTKGEDRTQFCVVGFY